MIKRYRVTFEIEGEMIADDMRLNMDNLELVIKHDLHAPIALSYVGNRSIDTKVEKLVITKQKPSLPF
jgi:hypothetical protein